jgi:proteic killer suppression protein
MLDVTHNRGYPAIDCRLSRPTYQRFCRRKASEAVSGIERPARLKLDRLEAALVLKDLAVLPGNRFEALGGGRKGQYSIHIIGQWRICFEWPGGAPGPSMVEIVDYH